MLGVNLDKILAVSNELRYQFLKSLSTSPLIPLFTSWQLKGVQSFPHITHVSSSSHFSLMHVHGRLSVFSHPEMNCCSEQRGGGRRLLVEGTLCLLVVCCRGLSKAQLYCKWTSYFVSHTFSMLRSFSFPILIKTFQESYPRRGVLMVMFSGFVLKYFALY